jgi:hypothetical protein
MPSAGLTEARGRTGNQDNGFVTFLSARIFFARTDAWALCPSFRHGVILNLLVMNS